MQPFAYAAASGASDARRALSGSLAGQSGTASAQYPAGGTNLLDFMKLDVLKPGAVVDINHLTAELGAIAPMLRGCISARWCAWPRRLTMMRSCPIIQ